jgi:hypothetical protein
LSAAPSAQARAIASFDTFAELGGLGGLASSQAGAAAVDRETAAVLALATRLGMRAASGLVVAETAAGEEDEGATEAALLGVGGAAAAVLAAAQDPASALL